MIDESVIDIIRQLEDQKIERELALREALDERKRAFELAKLQYAYPYKVVASFAVCAISSFSAFRHKNVLHLIPAAIAIPYIAYETDLYYGNKVKRLKIQADLLYRKRLAEHEPHIMLADVRQRQKELEEERNLTENVVVKIPRTPVAPLSIAAPALAPFPKQATEHLALQNILFEHKRAIQLANSRKVIAHEYLVAFLTVSLMLACQKVKQSYLFAVPTVPLIIGLCYNFDQQRDITVDYVKEKAEQLRRENRQLFEPIGGPITLAEIDRRIMRAKFQEVKPDKQNAETI